MGCMNKKLKKKRKETQQEVLLTKTVKLPQPTIIAY